MSQASFAAFGTADCRAASSECLLANINCHCETIRFGCYLQTKFSVATACAPNKTVEKLVSAGAKALTLYFDTSYYHADCTDFRLMLSGLLLEALTYSPVNTSVPRMCAQDSGFSLGLPGPVCVPVLDVHFFEHRSLGQGCHSVGWAFGVRPQGCADRL